MTKHKRVFLIIFIFLLPTQFSLAENFSQDVPDPLAQYQVEGEAKGILQKIMGEWRKINDWGTGFYTKSKSLFVQSCKKIFYPT